MGTDRFWLDNRLNVYGTHGDSRAVSVVDVDGDGWLDIVFTHRGRAPPDLWHNNGLAGEPGFTHDDEFNVRFGNAMSWADLDGETTG
jgi:hypothetical protein